MFERPLIVWGLIKLKDNIISGLINTQINWPDLSILETFNSKRKNIHHLSSIFHLLKIDMIRIKGSEQWRNVLLTSPAQPSPAWQPERESEIKNVRETFQYNPPSSHLVPFPVSSPPYSIAYPGLVREESIKISQKCPTYNLSSQSYRIIVPTF